MTVGVARTKFLAKVASGVAKPDGLLVVPPEGELAFLHPLPVERLWGVGRVTGAKLRERGIETVGQVAWLAEEALVGLLGRASGRHLHALAHNRDPRRVQRRPPARLDRLAARARPLAPRSPSEIDAVLVGLVDRVTRRMRKAAAGRPHRRAAAALRRLLARDALAHAARRDRGDLGDPRDRARRSSPTAAPMIERQGLTLVGVAVANLENDDAVQLALPFERAAAAPSTPRSTRCASGSARRRSPEPCCSAGTGLLPAAAARLGVGNRPDGNTGPTETGCV